MAKAALVTVGMPVYNGSSSIAAAIESVLNQQFADFELIVYDDGSTDDTWSICQQYAESDPRIRLINAEANLGRPAARNHIIDEARTEFLAWLDADDLWRPKKLKFEVNKWRKAAAKHPDVGVMVVSPYLRRFVDHTRHTQMVRPPSELTFEGLSGGRDANEYTFMLQASFGPTELYRRIGKFDDRLNWAEDYDLVVRLIQGGVRIFGVPRKEELVVYNFSIIGKSPDVIMECQRIVRSKHRKYFREQGVDIGLMYGWRFVRYTIHAFLDNQRAQDAIAPLSKLAARYGSDDPDLLLQIGVRLRQIAIMSGAKPPPPKAPSPKKPARKPQAKSRKSAPTSVTPARE